MQAIKIEKKVKLDKFELVKYQLIHHCFINRIKLSETELNCLALLGELGNIRLTDFCKKAADKSILGSPIAVSSCLSKIEKSKLFLKTGMGKKLIFLNPDLQIKSEGNIILEIKLFKVETNTTAGSIQNHSKKTELTGELR